MPDEHTPPFEHSLLGVLGHSKLDGHDKSSGTVGEGVGEAVGVSGGIVGCGVGAAVGTTSTGF